MPSEWFSECRDALEAASRAEARFISAFDRLPLVDRDGTTDCPYSEDLYRASYELEYWLRKAFAELVRLREAGSAAIEEVERKLSAIDVHAEHADWNMNLARIEVSRYRRMAKAVWQRIDMLNEVLREAKAKRHPNLKPVYTEADLERRR